jgi:hypothetical protein
VIKLDVDEEDKMAENGCHVARAITPTNSFIFSLPHNIKCVGHAGVRVALTDLESVSDVLVPVVAPTGTCPLGWESQRANTTSPK